MQDDASYSVFRFTSEALPAPIRREAFCDVIGREILRVDIDPAPDWALDVDMSFRALPHMGLGGGRLSPIKVTHLAAQATDDDPILVVLRAGGAVAHQAGHEAEVVTGQAVLTANGERGWMSAPSGVHVLNLRFDRSRLWARLARPMDGWMAPIPAASPALRLLTSYVGAVEQTATLDQALAEQVSTHLYDLAALVLGSTPDAAHEAHHGGVKAARLQAMKADIAVQLGSGRLSAETLGRRHGVSERYVQMLFAEDGSTLSQYVAEQRVEAARRMLLDPRNLGQQIIEIAHSVGFNDISYFNRLFRRQVGCTPREIRSMIGRKTDHRGS